MKSLLDPTFRYVHSSSTDIRKTFSRVRKELRAKADAEARERAQAEADAKANAGKVASIIDGRRKAGK